jgi:hypothetical protein
MQEVLLHHHFGSMQYELLHRRYARCNSNYYIDMRLDAIQTIASTWGWMQFELLHWHEVGCNSNYCIDMRLEGQPIIASNKLHKIHKITKFNGTKRQSY